jgi:3-dehydroquinate synthase|uniref:3-dehydroquinate synthase n=1 Tax=Cephaloticoccus sp. TaxID=1985742 RepID=UPI004049056E
MVEDLTVQLCERSYEIIFGASLVEEIRALVHKAESKGRKVVVLTDTHLATKQGEFLTAAFGECSRCVVEPGESSKSMAALGLVWDFLSTQKIDRGGVLIAVGGGVIGDLGGFAAASYLRGIDFIQVPTTLLAMVDSSVGGKTGINIAAGKNLVGAFHQPQQVLVATSLLESLPAPEFAAGMAEVIKYGLLGDASLFEQLEKSPLTLKSAELPSVIRRCCGIKAKIVEADERETAPEGGRALLNLGHTFGHAIEQVSGYGVYLHGEAISIGLAAAARLSRKLGHIDDSEIERVESVLSTHVLPIKLRKPLRMADLMNAVARDKKVRAGLPRFVVMKAIGETMTKSGVEAQLVETCFREVGAVD